MKKKYVLLSAVLAAGFALAGAEQKPVDINGDFVKVSPDARPVGWKAPAADTFKVVKVKDKAVLQLVSKKAKGVTMLQRVGSIKVADEQILRVKVTLSGKGQFAIGGSWYSAAGKWVGNDNRSWKKLSDKPQMLVYDFSASGLKTKGASSFQLSCMMLNPGEVTIEKIEMTAR